MPVDGKKLRRSYDKRLGQQAIYMVSTWASENRLVLGQLQVDDKSSEIPAVPELLDALQIAGYIITTDAMNCQKKTAQKAVEKEADYVLEVKDNQGEDDSRVRKGNAAQNLAVLRHIALNLLKQETTLERGIKAKRLRSGWDHDYLLKVLLGHMR